MTSPAPYNRIPYLQNILQQFHDEKYVCPLCRCINNSYSHIQNNNDNDNDNDDELCYVCYENVANIIYTTCKHKCVCDVCLSTINLRKNETTNNITQSVDDHMIPELEESEGHNHHSVHNNFIELIRLSQLHDFMMRP
jgi:hypothetical protein